MKKHDIAFSSHGRIGLINLDGSGECYLEFDVPGQASWQLGPQFSDGRRTIVTSFEEGKAWEGKLKTRVWIYDWRTQALSEIATRERPAPFLVCSALLPGEQRMIAGPVIDGEQRVFTMNLDGTDPVEVTRKGDGFAYGVDLSPDAQRIAFHLTGPGDRPYRIVVSSLDGLECATVAHHPDLLFFGPRWSPDGEWLIFAGCRYKTDPGHDWCDLYLARPDGSECRAVTQGQSQWFGTSYGTPETRGGGSEIALWVPGGSAVSYIRTAPGSRTAWVFQPHRPDTDHFNRDYLPEQAAGGAQVCRLNPFSGAWQPLTALQPKVWDFRARWSPDGQCIQFCRAAVGQPSALWVMDADGGRQRLLTRGYEGRGVDHPVWLSGCG